MTHHDNAGTVPNVQQHDEVVATLRRARTTIMKRGYQQSWGAPDKKSPVNLVQAVTWASGTYENYLDASHAFSQNWGGPVVGMIFWETDKLRTQAEVIGLIDRVIARLETHETPSPGGSRSRGPAAT